MVVNNAFEKRFILSKKKLLLDENICIENRNLFKKFFDYEEVKLKRINNLSKLDEGNYKTLYLYIQRFRNTNKWFKNKSWKKLTKSDIKKVYNDLEDGKILNKYGVGYAQGGRLGYYSKVFKSEPFKLAGIHKLAEDVIKYVKLDNSEVRFIPESDFLKLVNLARKDEHKLLLWLSFDIGENITSLLKLKKCDFYRQINPDSNEIEYRINLRKDILKRSRKPRSELTNHHETCILLDLILSNLKSQDQLFNFDYRNAKKIIDRLVKKLDLVCIPNGEKVTWKDLRSSMACDLLKKGWSSDWVNKRLGHKPSSSEIDKYINFLAIDRYKPKKLVTNFKIEEVKHELELLKNQNKILNQQINSDLLPEIFQLKSLMKIITKHMINENSFPDVIRKKLKNY